MLIKIRGVRHLGQKNNIRRASPSDYFRQATFVASATLKRDDFGAVS
jgi:hypothetical protein